MDFCHPYGKRDIWKITINNPMSKLLNDLSKQMTQAGVAAGSRKATQWLQAEIPKLGQVNRARLVRDPMASSNALIGTLNLFYYDAKLKAQLPYWDRFPVTLVLDFYHDGFLGLNFHYLPVRTRLALLDKLMDFQTNKNLDEQTRLAVTYGMLKGVARYKAFKPCIKRYLSDHIESRIIPIPAQQWEMVVMLPVESWQGGRPY